MKRLTFKTAVCALSLTVLAGCGKKNATGESASQANESIVKVGILHSLSGTMAISEVSLRDVLL
ncbi:MAG: transporter substrate-binding protein, partial [Dysgonamonadaceae bacterium]|nr:transporter substrate-binding protein [Dysgonamonadaceae bacterium]